MSKLGTQDFCRSNSGYQCILAWAAVTVSLLIATCSSLQILGEFVKWHRLIDEVLAFHKSWIEDTLSNVLTLFGLSSPQWLISYLVIGLANFAGSSGLSYIDTGLYWIASNRQIFYGEGECGSSPEISTDWRSVLGFNIRMILMPILFWPINVPAVVLLAGRHESNWAPAGSENFIAHAHAKRKLQTAGLIAGLVATALLANWLLNK